MGKSKPREKLTKKRSMATRDSSAIGRSNVRRSKAHERQVAKFLTDWSGVQFRRRRAEGRSDDVIEVEGAADVIPINSEFYFSVEAKCGAGFSLDAMFNNLSTTTFTSWWHQSTYDAKLLSESRRRKIYPMLFFRPFPNTNWVAFPVSATSILRFIYQNNYLNQDITFPHVRFIGYSLFDGIKGNVSHSPKNKKIVEVELDDVIMCRWHDFAKNVNPCSAFVSAHQS